MIVKKKKKIYIYIYTYIWLDLISTVSKLRNFMAWMLSIYLGKVTKKPKETKESRETKEEIDVEIQTTSKTNWSKH